MTGRVAQRQNARRTKKGRGAIPLLLFSLVMATFLSLLWAVLGRSGLSAREFPAVEGLDPRAAAYVDSPFATLRTENGEDELSYQINRAISLEHSKAAGLLCIASPIQNSLLMRVELVLDEGERPIFSSGLLLPGSRIETALMDEVLEPGEHHATAHFYALSPQSQEALGRVSQAVTVTVLS